MLDPDDLRQSISGIESYVSSTAFKAVRALEKNQLSISEQERLMNDRISEVQKKKTATLIPLHKKRDHVLKERKKSEPVIDDDGEELEPEEPATGEQITSFENLPLWFNMTTNPMIFRCPWFLASCLERLRGIRQGHQRSG